MKLDSMPILARPICFAHLRHQGVALLLPAMFAIAASQSACAGADRVAGAGPSQPGVSMIGVSKINGQLPPGDIKPAEITLLVRAPLGNGQVLCHYRTVRSPGTRAPIHVHPSGGSTCFISGESTLRIEGVPGSRICRSGECVFMSRAPAMINYNSSIILFEAIETYILKEGENHSESLRLANITPMRATCASTAEAPGWSI